MTGFKEKGSFSTLDLRGERVQEKFLEIFQGKKGRFSSMYRFKEEVTGFKENGSFSTIDSRKR